MAKGNEALVIIEEGTDVEGHVEISCCYSAFLIFY
jgi:hypothetical protein